MADTEKTKPDVHIVYRVDAEKAIEGETDCDGSVCYDEVSAKVHSRKDLDAIVAALRGAGFAVTTDRISKTILSRDPRPWSDEGPAPGAGEGP